MPIYAYRCPDCGVRRDVFKPLRELERVELCCGADDHSGPHLYSAMQRQVTKAFVVGDYPGYDCPVTGKWIEGRRAHEENLLRHNTRLVEPGEKAAAAAWRESEDRRLDAEVDQTVGEFVSTLSGDKQNELGRSLESGVDTSIQRL